VNYNIAFLFSPTLSTAMSHEGSTDMASSTDGAAGEAGLWLAQRLLNLLIDEGILNNDDAIALLHEGTEQLADAPAAERLRTLKTSLKR